MDDTFSTLRALHLYFHDHLPPEYAAWIQGAVYVMAAFVLLRTTWKGSVRAVRAGKAVGQGTAYLFRDHASEQGQATLDWIRDGITAVVGESQRQGIAQADFGPLRVDFTITRKGDWLWKVSSLDKTVVSSALPLLTRADCRLCWKAAYQGREDYLADRKERQRREYVNSLAGCSPPKDENDKATADLHAFIEAEAAKKSRGWSLPLPAPDGKVPHLNKRERA